MPEPLARLVALKYRTYIGSRCFLRGNSTAETALAMPKSLRLSRLSAVFLLTLGLPPLVS